jgi:hypothetical protein
MDDMGIITTELAVKVLAVLGAVNMERAVLPAVKRV